MSERAQKLLLTALERTLGEFRGEMDISYVEVVGCLELIKATVISEGFSGQDDDGESDDDI